MGVALVFLLLICKLTVATGTLSGLVFLLILLKLIVPAFYHAVESTNPFSIFIAWLNLDFGIETCFYNRMDAYSKTWLQFVFPVYIWVLVGLMILVSISHANLQSCLAITQFQSHPLLIYKDPSHIDHRALCHLP